MLWFQSVHVCDSFPVNCSCVAFWVFWCLCVCLEMAFCFWTILKTPTLSNLQQNRKPQKQTTSNPLKTTKHPLKNKTVLKNWKKHWTIIFWKCCSKRKKNSKAQQYTAKASKASVNSSGCALNLWSQAATRGGVSEVQLRCFLLGLGFRVCLRYPETSHNQGNLLLEGFFLGPRASPKSKRLLVGDLQTVVSSCENPSFLSEIVVPNPREIGWFRFLVEKRWFLMIFILFAAKQHFCKDMFTQQLEDCLLIHLLNPLRLRTSQVVGFQWVKTKGPTKTWICQKEP